MTSERLSSSQTLVKGCQGVMMNPPVDPQRLAEIKSQIEEWWGYN